MGKNIDWSNLGFGYVKTDSRYVSNFKKGAWDEGTLSTDYMVTISECACVLQYAQTVFEGMKAYTTEDLNYRYGIYINLKNSREKVVIKKFENGVEVTGD